MKKILDIFKYFIDHNVDIRKPRVKVDFLQKISFKFLDDAFDKSLFLSLKNISTSGIAFDYKGTCENLKIKNKMHLEFSIYGKQCPIEVEIVRIEAQVVGFRVVKGVGEFASLISNFYKVEFAAAEMSQIESKKLQAVSGGLPHWFHGDHNSELYFVDRDGKIINFHITFFGNTLEFDTQGKFIFGHIWNDFESDDKAIKYKGSNMIKVVDELEVDLIVEAKSFIWQIPLLEESFKKQIIDIIESNSQSLVA